MFLARTLLVSTVCLFAFTVTSHALPADRSVSYRIYQDPNNPSAGALFTVILELTADSANGSSVGWEVQEARITQHANGGNPARKWSQAAPTVGTADGLWWVTHADPQSPLVSEFTMPPSISGVADSDDPQQPDLEYAIAGRVYTPPPTGSHFLITAALDYVFAEAGSSEPEDEGEEEPGEVGDFEDAERPTFNASRRVVN